MSEPESLSGFWMHLAPGTILRHIPSGKRVRVDSMRGTWASVHYVRADGERDRRHAVGFSSHLPADAYEIERSAP